MFYDEPCAQSILSVEWLAHAHFSRDPGCDNILSCQLAGCDHLVTELTTHRTPDPFAQHELPRNATQAGQEFENTHQSLTTNNDIALNKTRMCTSVMNF